MQIAVASPLFLGALCIRCTDAGRTLTFVACRADNGCRPGGGLRDSRRALRLAPGVNARSGSTSRNEAIALPLCHQSRITSVG